LLEVPGANALVVAETDENVRLRFDAGAGTAADHGMGHVQVDAALGQVAVGRELEMTATIER
jgi:hypothetical protein